LDKYSIAETATFSKKINTRKYIHVYPKIFEDVYPVLRNNPFFGANIKKLKGAYNDIYRFRLGDYRLFYNVNEEEHIVFVITIEDRKDAYK
jgi:mRNA interferase RelE/StbE